MEEVSAAGKGDCEQTMEDKMRSMQQKLRPTS